MNIINKLDKERLKHYRKEHIKSLVNRFLGNKSAVIGFLIILFFVTVAIFANYLAPYDPLEIDAKNTLAPVSSEHIFGTDDLGRDTLSRIIYGARISVRVGFLSAIIAAVLGVLIGSLAGFYEGFVDNTLMRIMDAMFAFPAILLAIVMVAILGTGTNNAIIAIGIVYTPIFARIVRSAVVSVKESDYVLSAKALGQSNFLILFYHILPNCMGIIIVQATVTFAEAIIFESGLSFLGLGTQPPTPSWGKMLADAKSYMEFSPITAFFPGAAISVSVLGLNLMGDGLRDILDPRLQRISI
jgi:peptide/nickel transport system permease protein